MKSGRVWEGGMLSVPAILLFLVYIHTACPTVYVGDSGELTAAAHSLGIPHNSGYPLYAMLGKLFALMPVGSIGFRLNLMSVFFAVLTVWIVSRLIWELSGSLPGSLAGGALLGAAPLFWGQTVSAEVYTLHTFFVALLTALLAWWDRDRAFYKLALFAVATGLSFGNHLQTVMMAPAVFFFILSGEKKALLNVRAFSLLSLLFLLPLLMYLYLPIRTQAGAAIHWGDPNSLDRFLAHVTATSHREGYVFALTLQESLVRLKEALGLIWEQFGVLLFIGGWGALVAAPKRWTVFFGLLVLFDLFYTVDLNTVSLQATAFMLPTCIALCALIGVGFQDLLGRVAAARPIRVPVKKGAAFACVLIPGVLLALRIGTCDQSRNYTAYEHALNVLRTCSAGSTVVVEGDNQLFPLVYGRIAERMGETVTLYDRHNIVFKMPCLGGGLRTFVGSWPDLRRILEPPIIKERASTGIYYAVFNPSTIPPLDGFGVISWGILYRVARKAASPPVENPWPYYASESFFDPFERDYLTRQLAAHFFFQRGTALFRSGDRKRGMAYLERASRIGPNDTGIHSRIASFLVRHGYVRDALRELEKVPLYKTRPFLQHNTRGDIHFARGEYRLAAVAFAKAVATCPENPYYQKNLEDALRKLGWNGKQIAGFQTSLFACRTPEERDLCLRRYRLVDTLGPGEDSAAPGTSRRDRTE